MHAAHGRDFDRAQARPYATFEDPRHGYGARRANLPAMAAIVAGHAALLALLATAGVIPLRAPPPPPLVVELIPETPPPPAVAVEKPPVTPVVTPPPIVRTEAPPPTVVAVVAPPPVAAPVAEASAPVAAPTPAAPVAAPITPPDFSAGYLHNPPPRYPIESRRAREQGTVRIKVLVDAGGGVEEIKLAASSGSDRLDQAALDAVRRWRFAPARQAGQPVAAWVIVPITLALRA